MKRLYSRKAIFGLESALASKFDKNNIAAAWSDVESLNNTDTVPSTASIVSLKAQLENAIQEVSDNVVNIIDDTATDGGDKTWSIDKIKQFVASVDDTVVVNTIQDRDALQAYDSLIAFVLDTTGDSSLGEFEGQPYTYIYANGEWKAISPVAGELDTTVFVKYSDIVNDLTSGGTDKPLSAEMGKQLAGTIIPNAISDAATSIVTEDLTINSDKLTLAANPIGAIVMNRVEIVTDEGIEVVEASVTGDKEVTIDSGTAGEFDGKTARVSYLAYTKDLTN